MTSFSSHHTHTHTHTHTYTHTRHKMAANVMCSLQIVLLIGRSNQLGTMLRYYKSSLCAFFCACVCVCARVWFRRQRGDLWVFASFNFSTLTNWFLAKSSGLSTSFHQLQDLQCKQTKYVYQINVDNNWRPSSQPFLGSMSLCAGCEEWRPHWEPDLNDLEWCVNVRYSTISSLMLHPLITVNA